MDATSLFEDPFDLSPDAKIGALRSLRKRLPRIVAPAIALLLIVAIGFVWFSPGASSSTPSLSGISQQSFGNAPASGASGSDGNNSGDLHVYVVGAVKHPGVYDLPAGARVYQLIAAAGGALPDANLVALNMAATLTDGQEVYVISKGEIPPSYLGGVPGPGGASGTATASGQLININTASVDEMRNALHISSTTAQNIVNYRTQHGPFTSVDQLLQVVSKSIYDKIKGSVTV
jgi:competence protein ComEA